MRFGPASAVALITLLVVCASMAVGAGRASAAAGGYWSPVVTGPTCGAPPCYVWRAPDGTMVEGVKQISQVEFENLETEAVATIDTIGGKPTTGIATAQLEAGKTVAAAAEAEGDTAVLGGVEEAAEAVGVTTGFSALGGIALGATAFTVGWNLGEAIDALVGIEAWSPFGTAGSGVSHFYPKWAIPYTAGQKLTFAGAETTLKTSGFVLLWCESTCSETGGAPGSPGPAGAKGYLYDGQPAGFSYVQIGTHANFKYPEETIAQGYWFEKAPITAIRPHSATPFPGVSKTVNSRAGSPGTLAEQKARVGSRVLENPADAAFNEWLPAHDGVEGHSQLLSTTTTVPACVGDSYSACVAALEERDLKPQRIEKNWQTADITEPADDVLELDPAKATEVEKGSTVKVTTNPGEEGMPVLVPSPGASETYSEYVAKLNPALSPHQHLLGELTYNPSYGPNAVTGTSPSAGTRVNPATSTSLDVEVNPATAPNVSSNGGGWSPPAIDPVNLAPLSGLHVGCTSFPFGIFCWLKDGLTSWGPGGACPDLSLPFVSFGNSAGHFDGAELKSSTCGFEPAMEIIRPMLVVLACISLAAMFAYAALGIGGGGAGTDG